METVLALNWPRLSSIQDQQSFVDYVRHLSSQWTECPDIGMVTSTPPYEFGDMAREFGLVEEADVAFFDSAYNRGLGAKYLMWYTEGPTNRWQQVAEVLKIGVNYE